MTRSRHRIRTVFFGLLLASMGLARSTAAEVGDNLFTPDLYDAVFFQAMTTDGADAMTVTPVQPYTADMVNTEAVAGDGEGVYVAILDTGLLSVWPLLFPNADIAVDLGKGFTHDIYWDDQIGDIVIGPLRDDRGFITDLGSGHGTHIASTVLGFDFYYDQDTVYAVNGIAPRATIIPVLVLDAWEVYTPWGALQFGGGTDVMIAAGVYYIADLAPTLDGPVIINLSLGGPEHSEMIESAIAYAIAKGVIVVASAGNDGTYGMGYPGGMREVISVGAIGWASMLLQGDEDLWPWLADVPENVNTRDLLGNPWQYYLEDFSSRPNKDLDQKYQDLDVSAPGSLVVGPFKLPFDDEVAYWYLGGTSMSAAHVTGIAALVAQARPDISQARMERTLRLAAAGFPLPACDALVAYFEGIYPASWDGGDYGKGFLTADAAMTIIGR